MDIESRCPAIEQELATLDAYWRAANYLSACQLYLLDDPLLQKPLTEESIKKKDRRPLGHRARSELYLHSPQPSYQKI